MMTVAARACVLAAALLCRAVPETVIGGPYVVNVGSTSATIKWLTDGGLRSKHISDLHAGETPIKARIEALALAGVPST